VVTAEIDGDCPELSQDPVKANRRGTASLPPGLV
jgi:hypothetical protein